MPEELEIGKELGEVANEVEHLSEDVATTEAVAEEAKEVANTAIDTAQAVGAEQYNNYVEVVNRLEALDNKIEELWKKMDLNNQLMNTSERSDLTEVPTEDPTETVVQELAKPEEKEEVPKKTKFLFF